MSTVAVPRGGPKARGAREAFVLDAAGALHALGSPAHRLEAAVLQLADALHLHAQVFATQTSIFAAFGRPGAQRVTLLRVAPGSVDLGRLSDVNALIARVAHGELTVPAARAALRQVMTEAPRTRWWTLALAGSAGSAGAAVLFGGGVPDVAVSAGLGFVLALIGRLLGRSETGRQLYLIVAAAIATITGHLCSIELSGVHAGVVILSGIVSQLPGLSFTVAAVELARSHLASGTARLAMAAMTLLRLVLGVAIAQQIVPLADPVAAAAPLPGWALPLTVALAPIAFGVELGARKRDLPSIALGGILAFSAAFFSRDWLGPDLSAGLGAFVLSIYADAISRLTGRTPIVPLVTGVLLLVPGSLGFRSLTAMLDGEVTAGIDQAFHAAMVAIALAAGIVAGALPSKR